MCYITLCSRERGYRYRQYGAQLCKRGWVRHNKQERRRRRLVVASTLEREREREKERAGSHLLRRELKKKPSPLRLFPYRFLSFFVFFTQKLYFFSTPNFRKPSLPITRHVPAYNSSENPRHLLSQSAQSPRHREIHVAIHLSVNGKVFFLMAPPFSS